MASVRKEKKPGARSGRSAGEGRKERPNELFSSSVLARVLASPSPLAVMKWNEFLVMVGRNGQFWSRTVFCPDKAPRIASDGRDEQLRRPNRVPELQYDWGL